MDDKAAVVKRVLAALADGNSEIARAMAQSEYGFSSPLNAGRTYTPDQMMAIFIQDGFVDRYSGNRLVFPGALRLLSRLLPAELPFHKNWKMSECHMMYWELFPTVDHIIPVGRGGADDESNWVTTSMLRNSAKSNWLLSELGWTLVPRGDFRTWDGLTRAFIEYVSSDRSPLADTYIRRWYNAAVKTTAG